MYTLLTKRRTDDKKNEDGYWELQRVQYDFVIILVERLNIASLISRVGTENFSGRLTFPYLPNIKYFNPYLIKSNFQNHIVILKYLMASYGVYHPINGFVTVSSQLSLHTFHIYMRS